jgi:Bacteriophage probable baseplate hub protein
VVSNDLFYSVNVDASGAPYDLSDDITSLVIDQQEGSPDHLTVNVSDPFKVLSHALQEGMDIEVDLGTDDDHSVVFRGRIYRSDGTFPKDDVPTLQLEAYDKSMKMGLRKRNRCFTDMALSDIVNNVASAYFRNINVDVQGDPSFSGNGLRQDEQTDLAFLLELARTYGCIAYVSIGEQDDTFNFVSQHSAMTADPAVTLYYGRTNVPYRLVSFHSTADVSDMHLPRVLSGIDPDTGEASNVATTEAQSAGTDNDSYFDDNLTAMRTAQPVKAAQLELLLASAPGVRAALQQELGQSVRQAIPTFATQSDISALAQNQFSTSLRGMRASGSAVGLKELVACTNVDIEDVGGRFSGTWYLSQVRHTLNREGFNTEFECWR